MSANPLLAPLQEARRRNERWASGFVAIFATTLAVFVLLRLVTEYGGSLLLPSLAVAYALYYSWAFVRAARVPPSDAEAVIRTLFEVSAATISVGIRALDQPAEEILLDAPVLLYAVATALSVLRLHPWLPLLAGGLGGLQWLLVYAVLASSGEVDSPLLGPVGMVQRALILGFMGVLGARVGQSMTALTTDVARTTRDRERVRRALGLYVAEPVVERVLGGDLVARTERREITVLFVDIRGFTAFSEGRPPDEVLDRLALALDRFARDVQRNHGVVSKLLGDGLMAIFGAPAVEPDHARNATAAALDMLQSAEDLARTGAYPGLRIGVGLHRGEVVVGDVGGEGHREYTAIGDAVNVAARVEEQTKRLGEPLLVTGAVAAALRNQAELEPIASVQLRGREEEEELYAVRSMRRAE